MLAWGVTGQKQSRRRRRGGRETREDGEAQVRMGGFLAAAGIVESIWRRCGNERQAGRQTTSVGRDGRVPLGVVLEVAGIDSGSLDEQLHGVRELGGGGEMR